MLGSLSELFVVQYDFSKRKFSFQVQNEDSKYLSPVKCIVIPGICGLKSLDHNLVQLKISTGV